MGFLDRLLGKESSKSDSLSLFDEHTAEATVTRDGSLSEVNTVLSSPQTKIKSDWKGNDYPRKKSLRELRGNVFDSAERGHVTALFILDNRFAEIGISRDDAIDYLYLYLNGFSGWITVWFILVLFAVITSALLTPPETASLITPQIQSRMAPIVK